MRSPGCQPSLTRTLLVLYSAVVLSDRIVLIFQQFYFKISSYASSLWSQGLLPPPFKVITPPCMLLISLPFVQSPHPLSFPHLRLPCPQAVLASTYLCLQMYVLLELINQQICLGALSSLIPRFCFLTSFHHQVLKQTDLTALVRLHFNPLTPLSTLPTLTTLLKLRC